MGIYINPKDQTKEQWLIESSGFQGVEAMLPPNNHYRINDGEPEVVVCLVNNGGFSAAAVCYNDFELQGFQDPRDQRPKLWLWVPINRLSEILNENELEAIEPIEESEE